MRRIIAFLLCLMMLSACAISAFASEPGPDGLTGEVAIPDHHKITIAAEGAEVFCEGISGLEFDVPRVSEPRLLIRPESGKVLKSVTVNGEDASEQLQGGYLALPPVYDNQAIVVVTEEEADAPEGVYTIKGKLTLNNQPLEGVDLELRSVLKTAKTNQEGGFSFEGIGLGTHSLTALKEGKVIGYLFFYLKKDAVANASLLGDGNYEISVAQNSLGAELHLDLNEEAGSLVPIEIKSLSGENGAEGNGSSAGGPLNLKSSLYWLWILAGFIIVCVVVLVVVVLCQRKAK